MKQIFIFLFCCTTILSAQYSLQINNKGGAKNNSEQNFFSASVLNSEGKTLYTISKTLPFDVPFPSLRLDETSGTLAAIFAFDGFVEVYNNSGKKIWEHNFFKEMSPNYERLIQCVIHSNALYFLTSDQYLPKAMLHKFSLSGAQQWQVELPHQMSYELAVSTDGKTIIAGTYIALLDDLRQSSTFVSEEGKILGEAKILFRKAAFSPDNKFVALISEREAVVVTMDTKAEIGRIARENGNAIFTDLCWHKENLILQEAIVEYRAPSGFIYTNPIFTTLTTAMKKISVEKLSGVQYSKSTLTATTNGIEFLFDGKKQILK